ncbi:MAG: type II toxin-antitoxin system VapC family toxin [Caulobacteraceae bacterium]
MRLLLDTHAFVWAVARSDRLSVIAASMIADPANAVLVSVVSAYEIEFKRPRDPFLSALPADLDEAVRIHGFEWLPLSPSHATTAGRLPRLHGDPFDRMLAAQGLIEHATLLTRDPLVAAYGSVVIW